jgi:lipoic acid synthetase
MGENVADLEQTMKDLRGVDCDLLTIGQYLRPSQKHLPTQKYYTPSEFEDLKQIGINLGFKHVASGPLVRSSYHADEQHQSATL